MYSTWGNGSASSEKMYLNTWLHYWVNVVSFSINSLWCGEAMWYVPECIILTLSPPWTVWTMEQIKYVYEYTYTAALLYGRSQRRKTIFSDRLSYLNYLVTKWVVMYLLCNIAVYGIKLKPSGSKTHCSTYIEFKHRQTEVQHCRDNTVF